MVGALYIRDFLHFLGLYHPLSLFLSFSSLPLYHQEGMMKKKIMYT